MEKKKKGDLEASGKKEEGARNFNKRALKAFYLYVTKPTCI